MRVSITRLRMPVAMTVLAVALPLMTACPKHENFPQPLAVQPVPVPTNLSITQLDENLYNYDLTWDIDDPDNLVVGYRIYLVGTSGLADELIAESSTTSAGLSFPFSASGAQLAVTAISSENVEGYPVIKRIP